MSFQDWTTITWDKRNEKRKDETKEQQIKRLQRSGNSSSILTTTKNVGNKQSTLSVDKEKLLKIDREEDTFILPKVSLSMGKKIAQLRCEKKLSQKDLAMKLSLNVKIIQEYESSKAIPNPNIINKLETILGKIRE